MKRPLAVLATLVLPLALVAGDPAPPDAAPCPSTAGRDAVTVKGLEETLAMPVMGGDTSFAADLAGRSHPSDVTRFLYADLAPYTEADLTLTVAWETPGDLDLDVYAADGSELGGSHEFNPETGVYEESVTFSASDCQPFHAVINSYLTVPQDAVLTIAVAPTGVADDVAARTPSATPRYLTSARPGQAGPVGEYAAGADAPVHPTFSDARPAEPVSDQITRPAAGFANHRNPFIPYWHHEVGFTDPSFSIVGPVSAELWVSSPTMRQQPSTLLVQLYIDGGLAVEAEVDGSLVGEDPTPLLVDLGTLDYPEAYAYTLQVAAIPVVSTSGNSDQYGDLTHTVWFDGAQHASRLLLP